LKYFCAAKGITVALQLHVGTKWSLKQQQFLFITGTITKHLLNL